MSPSTSSVRLIPLLIAVAITLMIWFVIPTPQGVEPNAWKMLALFVGTIAAIIGKAMPIGAISVYAITLTALTGVTVVVPGPKISLASEVVTQVATLPTMEATQTLVQGLRIEPVKVDVLKVSIANALSGFSNALIWLIVISMMISTALTKNAIGKRIGYYFIKIFGKSTLGIAYGITFSELSVAPVTPSNTARGGAIIHPVMRSIATAFGSNPDDGSAHKMGRYLSLVNYQTNPITSAMFITATAPNPLVVNLIAKTAGSSFTITWGQWALAALLPCLMMLLLMPLVLYFLYPPEIKKTPTAKQFAIEELEKLGPLQIQEWISLVVLGMMLFMWAGVTEWLFGLKIEPTVVAMLGLSALLLTSVLDWEDILKAKSAWDTLVWFSALVMMATFLGKLGLTEWFALVMQNWVGQFGFTSWIYPVAILVGVYFYSHYLFASTTAHISAMFAAFYGAGVALGAPPLVYAYILGFSSSLMMTLTHYATGTAPIIYGSGYTTLGEWWKAGFIMSVVNLFLLVVVGAVWWKILGIY